MTHIVLMISSHGDRPNIKRRLATQQGLIAQLYPANFGDEIVVTPSGRAGSVGVYTAHDDISAALEKRGIKRAYISAGKNKGEGNETDGPNFIFQDVNRGVTHRQPNSAQR